MASISDQLKSLSVNQRDQTPKPPKTRQQDKYPIEKVIDGEFWQTSFGDVFVVETNYKAEFLRGTIKIKPDSPIDLLATYAGAPEIAEYNIEQFAFMDSETTGLGLGTGVYTFMVGIGRFEGDNFRLAQFFLREPGEELAQLAAIAKFLDPCDVWVSFNGKSFDIPLLNNRYIMHRLPAPLQSAAHIDLLHLARRLWKRRLPRRTLADLEVKILGASRSQQDTPGWIIPDLYFDYLQSGDARPLLGIFYHNEMDVVSLAALLACISEMIANPLDGRVEHGLDLLAIGKLYADLGYQKKAIKIYQQGINYEDLDSTVYLQAIKELSFLHKKQAESKKACALWERAAENKEIYAHVELAKYYEHHLKDYSTAIFWTHNAIEIVLSNTFPTYERGHLLPELKHRLARLERKMKNKNAVA
jgi:uncharacterized protein YprB with RNaseH-like and TPR domain